VEEGEVEESPVRDELRNEMLGGLQRRLPGGVAVSQAAR